MAARSRRANTNEFEHLVAAALLERLPEDLRNSPEAKLLFALQNIQAADACDGSFSTDPAGLACRFMSDSP
jgi:hypothetical protein